MRCWACSTKIEIDDKVYRQDTCPGCSRALHCCRNCRFYDEKAYNSCLEPVAERVTDKEAANFCDYFQPGPDQAAGGGDTTNRARKKLDDLFK
ncbi:MAG: hypothetical protein V1794_14795 [Candidatus Glassbacteria bacterium]